jgi:hypothetical protein
MSRSALKDVRDAAGKRRRRAFFIVLALILAGIGIWLGTRPQHKAGTAGSADLRAAPPRAPVAAAPRAPVAAAPRVPRSPEYAVPAYGAPTGGA